MVAELLRLVQSAALVGLAVAVVQRPLLSDEDGDPAEHRRRLQGNESGFPAGWNGEAASPPMLWRQTSTCMHAGLPGDNSSCPGGLAGSPIGGTAGRTCSSCTSWAAAIKAIASKNWTARGPGGGSSSSFSLADAGFSLVELDAGWEGVVNGNRSAVHDSAGENHINTDGYPDMAALVAFGHSSGLKMGWSLNNGNAEHYCSDKNMQGDIRQAKQLGFDSLRFLGYGPCRNATRYAELMQLSGKNFTVANAHWLQQDTAEPIGCHQAASGPVLPYTYGRPLYPGGDAASCPTLDWCPFNYFQMAADTRSGTRDRDSWYENLQAVVPFTTVGAPLSRPGCWAWLGNLQVGSIMDPLNQSKLDLPWNRAHFGAYCIVSSPLVLDVDALATLAPVVPIITNKDAIDVNQAWAGSPGQLLLSVDPDNPDGQPDAAGFIKLVGALGPGHGMRTSNSTSIAEAEAWCAKAATCEGFTFDNQRTPQQILFKDGMGGSTNNYTGNVVNRDPKWTTYLKYEFTGASALAQQVWGKPLPGGGWAVLAINGAPNRAFENVSLPLGRLNISGSVEVFDIWAGSLLKQQPVPGGGTFVFPSVAPRDSGFYKLTLTKTE